MTLAELYETYETQLQRYALRLAGDLYRADDLVQETFIRTLGHLDLLGLLKPDERRACSTGRSRTSFSTPSRQASRCQRQPA